MVLIKALPPLQLTELIACRFINLLDLTTYLQTFLSVSEPSPLIIPCMSTPVTPSYQNIAATVRHVQGALQVSPIQKNLH